MQTRVRSQRLSRRNRLRVMAKSRRSIAPRDPRRFFDPPEQWYPATGRSGPDHYRVVVCPPGTGYIHVTTPEQIRQRLSLLPQEFLKDLERVQLSRMTRKKECCPCYGLQWGQTIYLYPFDDDLEEHFYSPPPNYLVIETRMYGGKWDQPETGLWRLRWTESTARDFQLNNVLIHELGHLIDDRNTRYVDQERFAEWFAIEYGYRRGYLPERSSKRRKIVRRHHRK